MAAMTTPVQPMVAGSERAKASARHAAARAVTNTVVCAGSAMDWCA
jgi:hypothetical protein